MLSLDLKFRYSSIVSYDYDHSSCTGNCDDYCRCSVIVNKRITEVKPLRVFDELVITGNKKQNDYKFRKILGFILLKNFIKKAKFEVETCGGYYGEEVAGVRLINPSCEIEFLIQGFNRLNEDPDEQLLYVLDKEYGYVLPRIKDLKGWSYKKVELGSIDFSEEVLMRTSSDIVDEYAEFMFDEDDFNHKERSLLPGIICDNNNRIVDGYHRLATCKKNMKDTRKISIISPD